MREEKLRIAVLGAGGLGRAAVKVIACKRSLDLVAICDSRGVAYAEGGLDTAALEELPMEESVAHLPGAGFQSKDPIGDIISLGPEKVDGVFVALPNLPNEFIPDTLQRFIDAGFAAAYSDVLKRNRAVELVLEKDAGVRKAGATYVTGAGATPGLLTAAAVIAAQSFVEVEKVSIWWGVGVANWEEYKSTVREDIAHLPGYTLEKARALSDAEVEALLDEREGKLELHKMDHADGILLELVGVVDSRDKVEVGGIIDTRSAKKPVTTTLTVTGRTFDGQRSSHTFSLGDETTMAANVIGPALGYLKQAHCLRKQGIYGVFGSTQLMPLPVA